MVQSLRRHKESPSQTSGPYVHIGCTPNRAGIERVYNADLGAAIGTLDRSGNRIAVNGHIFDGMGAPLKDALVEIWQADGQGFHNSSNDDRGHTDPHFRGWARCATCFETGLFRFDTIKPGRVPFRDGRLMAPHITVWIAARGINIGLHTRMYFPDETQANAEDPVLARIENKARVATLIATQATAQLKDAKPVYTFDIYLQGNRETVFFDI